MCASTIEPALVDVGEHSIGHQKGERPTIGESLSDLGAGDVHERRLDDRVMPTRRRPAVLGAGASGAKVAQALRAHRSNGVDLAGYFDDRQGDRLPKQACEHILGLLADAAGYVRAQGAHDIHITLPLTSQPRVVELMEAPQAQSIVGLACPSLFEA